MAQGSLGYQLTQIIAPEKVSPYIYERAGIALFCS